MIILLSLICSLGIFLLFYESIIYIFKNELYRLRNSLKSQQNTIFDKINNHIELIFTVISAEGKEKKSLKVFYLVTITIFLISIVLLKRELTGIQTLLFTILMTIIPYCYIKIKLILIQREASFEGEILIRELVSQYKINYSNIIQTLDAVVLNMGDEQPKTKKAMFKLACRLKTCKNAQAVQTALDDFIFTYDTNWGRMLANNIFNAVYEKTDIQTGLNNLLEFCNRINSNLEEQKRNGIEAMAIVKYLGPCGFVLLAFLCTQIMEVSNVIQIVFFTPMGVILFCMLIIVIAFNYLWITLQTKPKYDA